jgi:hypothetical protein
MFSKDRNFIIILIKNAIIILIKNVEGILNESKRTILKIDFQTEAEVGCR